MLRIFDFSLSLLGLTIFSPVLLIVYLIGLFHLGSPIFRQRRVGLNQKPFILFKFRTMKLDTASKATHLVDASAITTLGLFLRRTKIDELPQLWNVLKGEMSLVGPRPCLFNQIELIEERESRNVFAVKPGITGLAQIKKINMSTPKLLADTDAIMLQNLTVSDYFKYIFLTLCGRGSGDGVIQ